MNSIRMMILGFLISVLTISCSTAQEEKPDDKQGKRPFIGIVLKNVEEDGGVHVVRVVPGSPAESKLEIDDVILKVGDGESANVQQLKQQIQSYHPGDVLTLTVRRAEKEMTVDVKLTSRPDFEPLRFPSVDGLEITADYYSQGTAADSPCIVLCHQAGWSRGEYREIAPKLNQLGFRCLAIDQRSGGEVNDVVNQTNSKAKSEGKETGFVDAEQDMIAALKFARTINGDCKFILWGSSYSSALALRIAGEHPDLVDGVLAFAPGEYFVRFGKPEDWITSSAKKIKAPAFITSAKDEFPRWEGIFDAIPGDQKTKFVPGTAGNHGSRALWEKFEDNGAYWKSVEGFLGQFK